MTSLHVTLPTAAILALILVWLSATVSRERFRAKVSIGDGSDRPPRDGEAPTRRLPIAIRSQSNFAEYVPFSLILLGLIESRGGHPWFLWVFAVALVLCRLAHPIGMRMKAPNPVRAGSITVQWLLLIAGALYGLWLYSA